MRSLTRRLIAVVMLVVVLAFALTAALTLRIVSGAVTRDFDARLATALNELASSIDIGSDGILSLAREPSEPAFSRPQSGWSWSVAKGDDILAQSRSLRGRVPTHESDMRTQTRIVGLRDRGDVTITVEGPARAIRDEIWSSARTLLVAFAIVALALLLALGFVIRRGLRPLRRLASDLDAASQGKDVRITAPGYHELDPLADSVRDLMAQVSTTVERSRAQSANLAHAIKTPLSLISARNQQRGAAKDGDVDLSVGLIQRQIDHHLKRARFAGKARLASERIAVAPVLDDIVLVMMRSYAGRNLAIDVDAEDGAVFLGEREDLEELLGNLLDNACKWARSRIAVSVHRIEVVLKVIVDDDGPGLSEDNRERALERGQRLDETVAGDGIGLAIVTDLAALYQGTLALDTAPCGGLRVTMTLPSAA